MTSKFHKVV